MRRYVETTYEQITSEVNVKKQSTPVDDMLVMRGQKDPRALRNSIVFLSVLALAIANAVNTRGWLEGLIVVFLFAPVLGLVIEMHDAFGKARGREKWIGSAAKISALCCMLAIAACMHRLFREKSPVWFAVALSMYFFSLRGAAIFIWELLAECVGWIVRKYSLARRRALR